MSDAPTESIRLDKWLWHARFFKTRTLAAKHVAAGHVRVNSTKTLKPAHKLKPGDSLTFAQGDHIRVVTMRAPGTRRGPAPEAQTLFDDNSPVPKKDVPKNPGFEGRGRPTKRDRRRLDLNRSGALE